MGDPLRVLIVIKSLGPGGAERLVVDQLRHADPTRFHYELFVCRPRDPDLLPELAELGTHAYLAYRHRRPWLAMLRHVLHKGRYDVVHCHLPVAAIGTRIAVRTLRPGRRPALVYTEHNRWPSYVLPTRWLNRATIGIDDLDIAVSADAAESMHYRPRRPVMVLTHGVNRSAIIDGAPTDLLALRSELGLPADHVVIGTVANLRRSKAQAELLDAFARADPADTTLAIVGQGPLRDELQAHATGLDLGDRVRFLGYRSDATRVMAAFDVFTLPSRHEGRPVALMEAMTLGLPPLVSDAGGMRDMVEHGVSGLVVPAGDADALVDALRSLASDPGLRERLGRGAAAAAAAFDGDRAFADIERRYEELTGH